MKLITERDKIREAIVDFRDAYGDGSYPADERGIAVGAELAKLDADSVSVDVVNELIGNGFWTYLQCDECSSYVTAIVELGQEPDWESNTARICSVCIEKAFSLFKPRDWQHTTVTGDN